MGTRQHTPTRAAIRFSFLVRQLKETGIVAGQKEFADAIGRSASLVSQMVRLESAGRTGLTDGTIQGIVDAFQISSDFLFLSDEQIAKRFGDRAKVVALPDGTTRPCAPGEVDAQLFSLAAQREVANERRIASLEKQVTELTDTLRRVLPHLLPQAARAKGE